ncbi:hypothetical protein Scep_028715 [Stephania cephalantha]|uniref:Uncharacterized protein n=1 Tax=Stephania cephalantha TaxID=152367 RepID=A0AAP0EHR8_9MAGN
MGTRKLETFKNDHERIDEQIKSSERSSSDSFTVDMESLEACCNEREINNWNSRITMHRSLSRKGSQRGDHQQERMTSNSHDLRDTALASSGVVGGGSPKATALLSSCTPEKSQVVQMPVMSTTEHIITPKAHQIIVTNNAETKCRRQAKPRTSWIDPWRVLVLFATLSSMGTIILIYFSLSMAKLNEDGSSHSQ